MSRLSAPRVEWALECGLAPVIARCCAGTIRRSSPQWSLIRGSDLAARVVAEDQAQATVELIEACGPRVGPLTLLKGIWLSHALHPEPHLRPMRDVDVMVEPEAAREVERILIGLGYRPARPDGEREFGHHNHLVPYRHPTTDVVVEVHHAGAGTGTVWIGIHVLRFERRHPPAVRDVSRSSRAPPLERAAGRLPGRPLGREPERGRRRRRRRHHDGPARAAARRGLDACCRPPDGSPCGRRDAAGPVVPADARPRGPRALGAAGDLAAAARLRTPESRAHEDADRSPPRGWPSLRPGAAHAAQLRPDLDGAPESAAGPCQPAVAALGPVAAAVARGCHPVCASARSAPSASSCGILDRDSLGGRVSPSRASASSAQVRGKSPLR